MQKSKLSKAIQIALYSTSAILPLAGYAQTTNAGGGGCNRNPHTRCS